MTIANECALERPLYFIIVLGANDSGIISQTHACRPCWRAAICRCWTTAGAADSSPPPRPDDWQAREVTPVFQLLKSYADPIYFEIAACPVGSRPACTWAKPTVAAGTVDQLMKTRGGRPSNVRCASLRYLSVQRPPRRRERSSLTRRAAHWSVRLTMVALRCVRPFALVARHSRTVWICRASIARRVILALDGDRYSQQRIDWRMRQLSYRLLGWRLCDAEPRAPALLDNAGPESPRPTTIQATR